MAGAQSPMITVPSREPRKGVTVYSYIVAFDSGFSPNPFHGVCTLACCKPNIRRAARVGDLVVGLSRRGERFVYAMRVDRVVDFTTYWRDRRYGIFRKLALTHELTLRSRPLMVKEIS